MRLFRAALVLAWFTAVDAIAGKLTLVSVEEVFLFGGRSTAVGITIRNDAVESRTIPLEWQLYQLSSATVAPAGEKVSVAERIFPSGQESIIRFPVQPPEVRTITGFLVKIWAEGNELGQMRVTVCPTNLFSQLKAIGIDVREPADSVSTLLEGAESETERKLSVVRLPDRETGWDQNDLAPAVLYIVSPGVQGAERLIPLKVTVEQGRRIGILQDWFVPDLENSALSQLRLLRAIDLMIKPDQVRSPASSK